MKLGAIEVGERYYASRDAPTDKPETIFGEETGRPKRLHQMLRRTDMRAGRRIECEVLAVRQPYKNGNQGVWIRVEYQETWEWCRCPMCDSEHPAELETPRDTSIECVVHFSQLASLAESVSDYLWWESISERFEKRRAARLEEES